MPSEEAIAAFYDEGGGARLADAAGYPPSIRRYLIQESQLIERVLLSGEYGTVLEVGCMQGRFLSRARALGLHYRGIDLAPKLVMAGQARCRDLGGGPEETWIWNCSAIELGRLVRGQAFFFPPMEAPLLALLPFNCIGNMVEPEETLASIVRCGFEMLICTYMTDLRATAVRRDYYAQCGYEGITVHEENRGVVFRSREGLRSIAFHPHVLKGMIVKCGSVLESIDLFAPCGIAYRARPVSLSALV
jgi:SAM-dependent methyltransferase